MNWWEPYFHRRMYPGPQPGATLNAKLATPHYMKEDA